jgi:hypothetical protein
MAFLAPLFLVAMAGLAIPVLLHLTQREKKQIVHFPSLMFVRRIPYQSVRRRKIHNWLLLALRVAALALIILAFARPLISGAAVPAAPGAGAREVVILLDNSYSMGYADRWEAARAAAHDVVGKLTPSDRASIVLFSSAAEIVLRSTAERSRLTAAVSAAKPGAGATRYAPALKVAGSILSESLLPRREVVLITDFQRSGWRGEEGARLPRGVTLTPVVVQGVTDKQNVSVTGVSLARSTFSNHERVAVTAGVINRSERPIAGNKITLEVGGIPVDSKPLMLDGGAAATVSFDPFTINDRNMRATVKTGDDALAADNSFNFVVSPSQPVRIALVDRGSAAATALYLTRALSIGDAPAFETVTRSPEALTDEDLRKSAVVLLNDVPVSVTLARRLSRFVDQGGGLFVATGERASWPSDVDILPGAIGLPVDRSRGDAARVGGLEYGHPVFEPFRAPRSGDFSSARIYGYRNIVADKSAQVLARFDAGAPAVLERRVGNGRVLLWASALDTSWSDLPIKPVFLPFIHQAMEHLAAYSEPQPWMTVGQVLSASQTASQKAASLQRAVLTPSGKRQPLEDEGSDAVELTEQGFYELRSAGNGAETDVAVVASNVDPAEADLTPMDAKELVTAALGAPEAAQGGPGAGVAMTPQAQEKNQKLWWYLMCAGIVLLGVETVLSNRMAKA